MNIADKIQDIIEQRNQQAQKLESVLNEWNNLKKLLSRIEEGRQKHLNDNSNANSNFARRLQNINFSTSIEKVNEELEAIENLKKRLSRPTLNIGVVGRMRQGKSLLLQRLTGLGDDEIPTSPGGVCTSGLSKIFHESKQEIQRNEIEFHSWTSLREIIHLYFDEFDLSSSNKPTSPDDLDPSKLPPLPLHKRRDNETKFQYGHLRKNYYGGYENYRSYITGSTKVIAKEDIKKYITQLKEEGSDNIVNWEHLAIKELRIYCHFPDQEVGKIGVIDLPGLGDKIIDTKLLISILSLKNSKNVITSHRRNGQQLKQMFLC